MTLLPPTTRARLTLSGWQQRATAVGPLLAAALAGLALGLAAVWLPGWLVVGLLPAALGVWWILQQPEIGLLVIVAVTGGLLDYDKIPYLSLGPISFHLTDLVLLLLLGMALVRLLAEPRFTYVATPLDLPLVIFYGLAALSLVTGVLKFGVSPSLAVRELRIVTYWLAFFAVTQLIRTPQQLQRLVRGLVGLALLMTGIVLLEMIFPGLPLVRVSSQTLVTVDQTFQGISRVWITGERLIYVMLIVAICLVALLPNGRQRWLIGGIAAFLSTWLFVSFQRNYWATTALALALLGVLLPWSARLRSLRWGALLLLIGGLLLFWPASPLADWGSAAVDRVLSVNSQALERDTSALLRQTELVYAFEQIKQYPVFGVGIGNAYRPWLRRFDYLPWATTNRGLVWYCHNAYVWIWVKMGTPALLAFLWLCAAFVWRGLRQWRFLPRVEDQALVLGFTLAFIGQMFSNLVAPNFIQNWILIVFPIMLGINELIFKFKRLPSGQNPVESQPSLLWS